MEAKGLQQDEELKMAALRNKRKRASSSSSYLEPAIAIEVGHTTRHIGSESRSHNHEVKARRNGRSVGILPSAISYASLSQVASSPMNLSNTYKRRPRHKTKEDRYDLRHARAHVQAPKERRTKKSIRPSRKEKTGSALLHNFAADNVASDRLTV